ncbi:MAG TPA: phage holin family protein [Chitinophagaceae bacterium]
METDQLKKDTEETTAKKAKDITDSLSDLAKTYYQLTVVNATQKATNIASSAVAAIILFLLGILVVFFGSFTLAWWLGALLENQTAGFGIVTGFYVLVTVIILALRKKIIFPYIRNLIIRKFYD